ncbi:hypothetical protein MKX01_030131 [Papaver californicum]|nr:hypothetical protein MKX01_030131 [Papaver californicum]
MPPPSLDSSQKTLTNSTGIIIFLLIFSSLCNLYLLISMNTIPSVDTVHPHNKSLISLSPSSSSQTQLSTNEIVFGIASSSKTWIKRSNLIRLWWKPNQHRGYVFLDRELSNKSYDLDNNLPTIQISGDTSGFPYTFKGGLRSAIRIARIVKEITDLNLTDVKWFVFGDDDTVFFVDNLVRTLSKYDYNRWYYIGSSSESYEQNAKYSFDMAFGGGGFAISYSLAKVLAKCFDSCLMRYPHVYGSDARVFSCVAELGVGLTHEPGFHQVDLRGDLFGLLSSHPLVPLVSLHHLDYMDSIFPNMNRNQALEHFFEAVNVDPYRILQHVVCYNRSKWWTISISWGYAIQVSERNQLLPDVLSVQRTFSPWKRGVNANLAPYMFNTKEFPRNPCDRPTVFFLESVFNETDGTRSSYKRFLDVNCSQKGSLSKLELIRVFSQKLELSIKELQAPRRHCCDVLPSSEGGLDIGIRECRTEELISMKSYSSFNDQAKGRHPGSLSYLMLSVTHSSTSGNTCLTKSIYVDRLTKSINVDSSPDTSIKHVVFGIASCFKSREKRKEYIRLWWKPEEMRGCVFVDKLLVQNDANSSLLHVRVSEDTSRFPYSFKGGAPSAIHHSDVRWFVFGDDDTVLFTENLVITLFKDDHNLWYYIGSLSETFTQNSDILSSLEMGYGGCGFALSYPLAKVLAKVLDSCLCRYPHLYGSDARIYSWLGELGVIDIRGDLFGLLASHPLAPLISLHHLDNVDPIYPNKTRNQAIEHLLKAATFDPNRIFSRTISISCSHAVQVFESNVLVRDLTQVRRTFKSWGKQNVYSNLYMFNTREVDSDPCKRPTIFFLDKLPSTSNTDDDVVIKSIYKRNGFDNCLGKKNLTNKLEEVRVFSLSHKLDLSVKQTQCCDVLPSSSVLNIDIRDCGEEELVTYMHP